MRHKVIIIWLPLFLLVALATQAVAQEAKPPGWIELEGVVDSDVTPSINVYANGPLKDMVGWTLYMQAGPEWSERLVGLTLTPATWVSISGSLGVENFEESPFRSGASIWMGNGPWSLLSLQEKGGSGHWQKNVGKYQATPTIAIGVLQQTFVGAGPYIEKKFGRLSFWGAYAVTDNKGLVTAHFNF